MDICFALNEGYVDYCRVTMVSLLYNNRDETVRFHVLTDKLSQVGINRMKSTADLYGAEINVYEMEDSRLAGQKMSWSKYAWYRIFAPDVLPSSVSKVLYLDCDVVVTGNISNMFKIDMTGKAVAAVTDIMSINDELYDRLGYNKEKGYFCTGVLLMNLDYFRRNNLGDKILDYAIKHPDRILFPDQDALNIVCQDIKVSLPLKYGILLPFYTNHKFMISHREEVIDSLKDCRIVHYAGCAPWIVESSPHFFEDDFWKYAAMIGGIKKIHCCQGISLMKLRIKQFLGYMGFSAFVKYRKPRKQRYSKIRQLLNF